MIGRLIYNKCYDWLLIYNKCYDWPTHFKRIFYKMSSQADPDAKQIKYGHAEQVAAERRVSKLLLGHDEHDEDITQSSQQKDYGRRVNP